MSCDEISEVMETSAANVKVLLHRSRNALKDIMLKKNLIEELS
jgi:DNA-directed RNA polymerase specialized sigma24 family protein